MYYAVVKLVNGNRAQALFRGRLVDVEKGTVYSHPSGAREALVKYATSSSGWRLLKIAKANNIKE